MTMLRRQIAGVVVDNLSLEPFDENALRAIGGKIKSGNLLVGHCMRNVVALLWKFLTLFPEIRLFLLFFFKGIPMKRNLLLAVAAVVLCAFAGSVRAAAIPGAIYLDGSNTISGVSNAVSIIDNGSPAATFSSTLVNSGTSYSGKDGGDLQGQNGEVGFLTPIPADAASATANPAPLGSFVMDLNGYFHVSQAGTYTFTLNNDDGGAFFVGGNGTAGSGTELAELDGQQGATTRTGTLNLGPNTNYRLEYVYYNSAVGNFDGMADNSGGGAVAFASIAGPGTVTITANAVLLPEPSSIVALVGLCGMGLIGLIRYRRRSASRNAG